MWEAERGHTHGVPKHWGVALEICGGPTTKDHGILGGSLYLGGSTLESPSLPYYCHYYN